MGNLFTNDYRPTRQRPPTNSGFLGRGRMTQHYDVRIYVHEITAPALGRELLRRCGNEGQHAYLDATGFTTLRFLRTAISFIPDAQNDGADMRNAAFILSQPGQEFIIQSGDGDWEFYFAEEEDGRIYGRCVRKPFIRYMWDGLVSVVRSVGSFVSGLFALAGPSPRPALPAPA